MSILIAFLLHTTPASALGRVTFGAEFTFFNPTTLRNDDYMRIVGRMREHLVDDQTPLGRFNVKFVDWDDEYYESAFETRWAEFTSPNGWQFKIARDVGVIEATSNPMSVEDWDRYKNDIQDAIFVSAANEGNFPALFQGGGHINLGLSAFNGNNLLLRNFVVDMINHNELFLGVFNYDFLNATPFEMLREDRQQAIRYVIDLFDAGEWRRPTTQKDFIERLWSAMFLAWAQVPSAGGNNKNHAISFEDTLTRGRIEIRGVRPQASVDVWVRQIKLIQNRLLYLERINKPIPINPIVKLKPTTILQYDPPVDPQEALQAFYEYVTESGLAWKDHTDYLWPKWVSDGEVQRFEESPWFKSQNSCASLIKKAG